MLGEERHEREPDAVLASRRGIPTGIPDRGPYAPHPRHSLGSLQMPDPVYLHRESVVYLWSHADHT